MLAVGWRSDGAITWTPRWGFYIVDPWLPPTINDERPKGERARGKLYHSYNLTSEVMHSEVYCSAAFCLWLLFLCFFKKAHLISKQGERDLTSWWGLTKFWKSTWNQQLCLCHLWTTSSTTATPYEKGKLMTHVHCFIRKWKKQNHCSFILSH